MILILSSTPALSLLGYNKPMREVALTSAIFHLSAAKTVPEAF
jgi:hypothetical protein